MADTKETEVDDIMVAMNQLGIKATPNVWCGVYLYYELFKR